MVINLKNDTEKFQYGIYHLLKMIFPFDTIVRNQENADVNLSFSVGDTSVSVMFGEKTHTEPILRDDVLLSLKRAVYRVTDASLPFGVLTGVRPSQTALKFETDVVSQLNDVYFVSPQKAVIMEQCAKKVTEVSGKLPGGQVFLYINVPFCPTRCHYCSFTLEYLKPYSLLIDDYFSALLFELKQVLKEIRQLNLNVRGVYMGGGTPTVLTSRQLQQLFEVISSYSFDITEFSVEAGRADTITEDKLRVMKAFGVNRVSINPQTLNEKTLRAIGRHHTVKQFYDAFDLSRKIGFETLNTDLIAGLSGENFNDFCFSLEQIKALSPEHITVHTLCKKRTSLLPEQSDQKAVLEVKKMLDEAYRSLLPGYEPYYIYRQKNAVGALENIGFMKNNKECVYNIFMMEETASVVAVGAGGTSKLVDFDTKKPFSKLRTEKQPERYMKELSSILEAKRKFLTQGQAKI